MGENLWLQIEFYYPPTRLTLIFDASLPKEKGNFKGVKGRRQFICLHMFVYVYMQTSTQLYVCAMHEMFINNDPKNCWGCGTL